MWQGWVGDNILEMQKFFTLKGLFYQAISRAKGFRFTWGRLSYCYICGRQEDLIFGLVKLIPFFDMSLENKLVYICDDHGRVTDYNCVTGEPIELPLPRSYGYRIFRNTLQNLILQIAFIARFTWIFSYSCFMWYVAIWPVWWYKELREWICCKVEA